MIDRRNDFVGVAWELFGEGGMDQWEDVGVRVDDGVEEWERT